MMHDAIQAQIEIEIYQERNWAKLETSWHLNGNSGPLVWGWPDNSQFIPLALQVYAFEVL